MFVSSLTQIWRNVLHHLLTNGSSAVNGCCQNESSNSWYKHHPNPYVFSPSITTLWSEKLLPLGQHCRGCKRCNAKFLQTYFRWRNKPDGLRVSTFSAIVTFCVNYSFKEVSWAWVKYSELSEVLSPSLFRSLLVSLFLVRLFLNLGNLILSVHSSRKNHTKPVKIFSYKNKIF